MNYAIASAMCALTWTLAAMKNLGLTQWTYHLSPVSTSGSLVQLFGIWFDFMRIHDFQQKFVLRYCTETRHSLSKTCDSGQGEA